MKTTPRLRVSAVQINMSEIKELTAEDIFSASDTNELAPLFVPQWQGTVYLRLITAGERDEFERQNFEDIEKERPRNVRARFAALVLCDKAGKRLFARDLDPQVLREKSGAALDLVFEAGMKHNCWREKDKEELEKNSGATAGGS